ncbi:MAG: AsmA family protein [Acetobacteraceae bacterium]|nr:AsmA family protein [Acetobacteraceae bacterium]
MATGRRKRWLIGLGVPVALMVAVVSLWRWDWFIPLLESRASVALGRPVRIGHLHVALGNPLRVTATDVAVANPPGWHGAPFAQVKRLVVDVAAWDYVRRGALVIPLVEADQPVVRLSQLPNGSDNYGFRLSGWPGGPSPRVGEVRISRGEVYAALARLRADFKIDVATHEEGGKAQIVAAARGTYGGAPITAQATAGAPLSLRDAAEPWPVDLRLENGPTRAALAGTLRDPLRLAGADLRVQLSGQDMSQLEALTGIAIPRTPPFRLTGGLDFANQRVRLRDLRGQVGNSGLAGTLEADPWKERPEVRVELQVGGSDLEGTLEADPWKERPEVRVDLRSRQVNLVDLGGFVGAAPGPAASAAAGPRATLLSDTPISVPRLRWADVHLRYRAQRIQGRSVPLDNLAVALDIENGQATLHPLSLGVGKGRIKANLALAPRGDKSVRARADIEFQRVDVSRLMGATQSFHGAGTVSGTGTLDATGDSLAALLANGDGGIRLGMTGGDLSAQLVNLSGLQFGSAVLSALGLPQRAPVKCFVADLPLRQGILTLQALVLDTTEGIVNGAGTVNLRDESLALRLRTEATHFSIGALPAPIHIGGTLRHPRIVPGAELAARGGIAAALGVVFPPLALLPTIQFGTDDDHRCDRLLAAARRKPGGERLPNQGAAGSTR